MKSFFKVTLLLALVACGIIFSCQDDNSVTTNPDADPLNQASQLTTLLTSISANDSIGYTAIDSTTCFRIKLPVEVVANGQQITVSDTTDYATVATALSLTTIGYPQLEYVYPITIVYPDGTEMAVANDSQYYALVAACNSDTQTISADCVAINYPVTVFGYNSNQEMQNTYDITNNTDLYTLLLSLGANQYYSIDYPITLTVGGTETVTVNSNADFQAAIYAAVAACQETTGPVDGNPANTCIPDSLQSQVMYAFPFSSATVTNDSVYDAVGGMHLNRVNVETATDRAGNANCALKFLGNPDSFLVGTNNVGFGSLNNMSISLWYKLEGDSNSVQLLVGRGHNSTRCPDTYGDWSVRLYDGNRAVFGYNNSVWENPFEQTAAPVWKHLVVTLDKGNQVLAIYINGQLQETATGIAGCGAGGTQLVTETGDFYIGEGFNGVIDDVAIFGSVLTPSAVTALYQAPACCQ